MCFYQSDRKIPERPKMRFAQTIILPIHLENCNDRMIRLILQA